MNTMTQERIDELKEIKEQVKLKNVDAVAQLLLDTREHNFKTQEEVADLRRLVTETLATYQAVQSKLNAMIAITASGGGHGEMGN